VAHPRSNISGSTQLSKEEIDRMVKDAQAHVDEDKRRREEIEVRKQCRLDSLSGRRQVRELGDRVPVNEKGRAEQLITEIRQLVKSNSSDLARLRQLTSDLQHMVNGLSSAAYSQTTSGNGRDGRDGRTNGGQPGAIDDVIDAEFKQTG
jgi:molecular chaperone DnaK